MTQVDYMGRELHPITCCECGKEDTVPFIPSSGKKIYCKECFKKTGQWRGSKERY